MVIAKLTNTAYINNKQTHGGKASGLKNQENSMASIKVV
jgi:hypothetical protein